MNPDPEQEQRWQTRVQQRLATAPEPDRERLAAGLTHLRERRDHRARGQRLAAWLAAALLLGAGTAAATWWAATGPQPQPAQKQPAEVSKPPEIEGSQQDEKSEDPSSRSGATPTEDDGRIIYQRVE